ncbi:unnamed protein product [marine sediment metagenome]|uniref:Uncharacterized protein n=1 Tax=marine sediment metagenome TaxID=412755 RepID=X1BUG5_9ZZZZ
MTDSPYLSIYYPGTSTEKEEPIDFILTPNTPTTLTITWFHEAGKNTFFQPICVFKTQVIQPYRADISLIESEPGRGIRCQLGGVPSAGTFTITLEKTT